MDNVALKLQQLKVINFRSYDAFDLNFSDSLNCITGFNGAGKTNVLDAIYFCSLTKSYFSSSDQFVLKQHADFFRLDARFVEKDVPVLWVCKAAKGKRKEILVNDVPMQRYHEWIGKFPCVMIAPNDNQLILDGSEERRKFMDATISQTDLYYLDALLLYNKILQQRNAYLKSISSGERLDHILMEAFDEQLAEKGSQIYTCRRDFIEAFTPLFNHFYAMIEENEVVEILYESQLTSNSMAEGLKENFKKDAALLRTSFGVHHDDLCFNLFDLPIRKTGSQGQQKTFLFALKMAQFKYITLKKGSMPILLLDDVFDKFDKKRSEKLFSMLQKGMFGQVFLTDANESRLNECLLNYTGDFRIFKVENRTITHVRTE